MSNNFSLVSALLQMQSTASFFSALDGADGTDPSSSVDGSSSDDFTTMLESALGGANPNLLNINSTNSNTPDQSSGLWAALSSGLSPMLSSDPIVTLSPDQAFNLSQIQSTYAKNSTYTPAVNGLTPTLNQMIDSSASKYGINPALVKGLIQQESGFQSQAVSSAGALGLMQLMPSTAAGLGVTNAFDPAQNIDGGVRHLKGLLERYNGNVTLALAAYNAGAGSVDKYGGVPPFSETQNYVRNVQALAAQYEA